MEIIEIFLAMEAARNTVCLGSWTKVYKDSPRLYHHEVFYDIL